MGSIAFHKEMISLNLHPRDPRQHQNVCRNISNNSPSMRGNMKQASTNYSFWLNTEFSVRTERFVWFVWISHFNTTWGIVEEAYFPNECQSPMGSIKWSKINVFLMLWIFDCMSKLTLMWCSGPCFLLTKDVLSKPAFVWFVFFKRNWLEQDRN